MLGSGNKSYGYFNLDVAGYTNVMFDTSSRRFLTNFIFFSTGCLISEMSMAKNVAQSSSFRFLISGQVFNVEPVITQTKNKTHLELAKEQTGTGKWIQEHV